MTNCSRSGRRLFVRSACPMRHHGRNPLYYACATTVERVRRSCMADVRPLPGFRYAAADELAGLVTPPYDVISPEAQERYYARHPHNIIRLELGRDEPGDDEPGDDELSNRYTRAAATF